MREQLEGVINRIRPALQADGGDCELVGVADGAVALRLVGSCQGCPSSTMTLKMGIERAIKSQVPDVQRVETII